jgi:hypothetical protein
MQRSTRVSSISNARITRMIRNSNDRSRRLNDSICLNKAYKRIRRLPARPGVVSQSAKVGPETPRAQNPRFHWESSSPKGGDSLPDARQPSLSLLGESNGTPIPDTCRCRPLWLCTSHPRRPSRTACCLNMSQSSRTPSHPSGSGFSMSATQNSASLLGPLLVLYVRSASDMIFQELLDVGAERSPIFLGKPFKFGFQGRLDH